MYNWKRNHATMHIKNRICTILTNSCSSSVDSSVSKSSASSRSQNDQTTSNDKQVYTVYIYIFFFSQSLCKQTCARGQRKNIRNEYQRPHYWKTVAFEHFFVACDSFKLLMPKVQRYGKGAVCLYKFAKTKRETC